MNSHWCDSPVMQQQQHHQIIIIEHSIYLYFKILWSECIRLQCGTHARTFRMCGRAVKRMRETTKKKQGKKKKKPQKKWYFRWNNNNVRVSSKLRESKWEPSTHRLANLLIRIIDYAVKNDVYVMTTMTMETMSIRIIINQEFQIRDEKEILVVLLSFV